jgi:hypothetical protein
MHWRPSDRISTFRSALLCSYLLLVLECAVMPLPTGFSTINLPTRWEQSADALHAREEGHRRQQQQQQGGGEAEVGGLLASELEDVLPEMPDGIDDSEDD